VEEGGASNVGDGRADLLSRMDNIDSECVHGIPTDVIAINPGDENLPLVVVDKKPTNHRGGQLIHLKHKNYIT